MDMSIEESLLRQIASLQSAAAKLAKLMNCQNEAIQSEDYATLEVIINQKQVFINQLRLYPHLKQNLEQALSEAVPISSQLSESFTHLEERIQNLALSDQAAIQHLKQRHLQMAQSLQTMLRDRQAAESYSQTQIPRGKRGFDLSG